VGAVGRAARRVLSAMLKDTLSITLYTLLGLAILGAVAGVV
jgi:hypothetical protein